MSLFGVCHICTLVALIYLGGVKAAPVDNPKSQVEYINSLPIDSANAYPNIVPITRPPLVTQTAPPPPSNSKNFAYNPKTQTWTLVAPGDPQPNDETLIWNKANDKWLTSSR
ncbi:uncharacterized protein LOC111073380 [Drosophila obscura]|uniref:uncharacterized protein LOC111073380 n=1 Tax=Drosophila obscura TaxID=7282 RepID=UPI001BB18D1B|nr:uncharacterized protein LOC111073380 [Drosophila obscura]